MSTIVHPDHIFRDNISVEKYIFADRSLNKNLRITFKAVCWYIKISYNNYKRPYCHIKQDTLANKLGVSKLTVINRIKKLIDLGLLGKLKRNGSKVNHYFLPKSILEYGNLPEDIDELILENSPEPIPETIVQNQSKSNAKSKTQKNLPHILPTANKEIEKFKNLTKQTRYSDEVLNLAKELDVQIDVSIDKPEEDLLYVLKAMIFKKKKRPFINASGFFRDALNNNWKFLDYEKHLETRINRERNHLEKQRYIKQIEEQRQEEEQDFSHQLKVVEDFKHQHYQEYLAYKDQIKLDQNIFSFLSTAQKENFNELSEDPEDILIYPAFKQRMFEVVSGLNNTAVHLI